MSKLLNTYNNLKKQNSDIIYLFKNGVFYLALEDDAKFLSNELNLKLTNLNDSAVKCGFPCSNFDKYYIKLKNLNIEFNIIEKDTISNATIYIENQMIKNILDEIISINIDNLSVSEAYAFIENLKEKASKINEGGSLT